MAYGDIKGEKSGKGAAAAFDAAKLEEELASEQDSNIEVGDFLGELASAIRFRMKSGLGFGDWIEEPERMFTDGLIFAKEEAVASDQKLQVTLSIDASTSMWMNRIMKHAGPSLIAFDRIIRKAQLDVPDGTLVYQPFMFHGTAHRLPASYLNNYVGRIKGKENERRSVWPVAPSNAQVESAIKAGELPSSAKWSDFELSGSDTNIAPLFRAIQEWEQEKGDPNAVRVDIILTDGVLENPDDVDLATRIQEERNGRLITVLLNFLPLDQWSNYSLPGRAAQYGVTPDNLDLTIRNILLEGIEGLLHNN